MPIYEFLCSDCQHGFEELLPSTDISKVQCPKCKGAKVKRQLSLFGIGKPMPKSSACDSCCSADGMPACAGSGYCGLK
ncbi:MAG: FmdB family zinc ribbon protein [Armatimonadota bacterium]